MDTEQEQYEVRTAGSTVWVDASVGHWSRMPAACHTCDAYGPDAERVWHRRVDHLPGWSRHPGLEAQPRGRIRVGRGARGRRGRVQGPPQHNDPVRLRRHRLRPRREAPNVLA